MNKVSNWLASREAPGPARPLIQSFIIDGLDYTQGCLHQEDTNYILGEDSTQACEKSSVEIVNCYCTEDKCNTIGLIDNWILENVDTSEYEGNTEYVNYEENSDYEEGHNEEYVTYYVYEQNFLHGNYSDIAGPAEPGGPGGP